MILTTASESAASIGGWSMLAQGSQLWIGLLLMLVVFYAIMLSGSRKDKKKRQEMLNAVSRNARVMTIGGIIGTVVSVNENEVTLKVDESSNVKITVVRGAIQKVLADDERPKDLQS